MTRQAQVRFDGIELTITVRDSVPPPPRPRPTLVTEARPLTDWEDAEEGSTVRPLRELDRVAAVIPLRKAS